MSTVQVLVPPAPISRTSEPWRLTGIYLIEALNSVASSLITIGIFFYTRHEFGWSLGKNFALSAGQGVFYTIGALAAHPLTSRFGWRGPLAGVLLGTTGLLAISLAVPSNQLLIAAALLLITLLNTVCWPILENLLAGGDVDPRQMSRRIALYNVVWSGVGVVMVAVSGLIIERFPRGVFVLPALASASAALIALLSRLEPNIAAPAPASRAEPEPDLARQRVLALWLARISMPAMYIVSYALAAMIPSLPLIREFRPALQTVLGSVWLISRFLAFILLGAVRFWHTRPRLLLLAAVGMLLALLMIAIRPGQLVGAGQIGILDLMTHVSGQVLLGLTSGLIYMGSLYFGMVLSEGSTEHGGYHEALIGVGMTLGPGAGVATQLLWAGNQTAAVAAVATLLGISIVLAGIASVRLSRPSE